MLATLVPKLLCPSCLRPDRPLRMHPFASDAGSRIHHGVLTCPICRVWYPIEDGLLELVVADLLDPGDRARFIRRFWGELDGLGLHEVTERDHSTNFSAQLKQRRHFDWYADNPAQDYARYQQSPFWVSADAVTFARWQRQIRPGGWLLDVGCANGRSAFPFAGRGTNVIGFDISKKLVRQAIERAWREGISASTDFFVADGSRLPLHDDSCDYIITYGVLHHLPSPDKVCCDALRVLKPGGVYFGSENNESIFRGLFDFMMRLLPLWTEEAGEKPLISHRTLMNWFKGQPADLQTTTSVFLPPHLFNLLGVGISRRLLLLTDRLVRRMPGARNAGGLLVFEIRKPIRSAKSLSRRAA